MDGVYEKAPSGKSFARRKAAIFSQAPGMGLEHYTIKLPLTGAPINSTRLRRRRQKQAPPGEMTIIASHIDW